MIVATLIPATSENLRTSDGEGFTSLRFFADAHNEPYGESKSAQPADPHCHGDQVDEVVE